MKLTKPITALLVGAMLLIQNPVRADDDPQPENLVAVCAVLAFGVVVVTSLFFVCKKLPPPPGTCQCGCGVKNCSCIEESQSALTLLPPLGPIVTNPPSAGVPSSRLTYTGSTPIGAGSFLDSNGNQWNYENGFSFGLQTSEDLTNWTKIFTVNGWLTTDSGALYAIRSNNVTLINAYFTDARNPTNGLPLDLPGGTKRFYRISCQ